MKAMGKRVLSSEAASGRRLTRYKAKTRPCIPVSASKESSITMRQSACLAGHRTDVHDDDLLVLGAVIAEVVSDFQAGSGAGLGADGGDQGVPSSRSESAAFIAGRHGHVDAVLPPGHLGQQDVAVPPDQLHGVQRPSRLSKMRQGVFQVALRHVGQRVLVHMAVHSVRGLLQPVEADRPGGLIYGRHVRYRGAASPPPPPHTGRMASEEMTAADLALTDRKHV